MSTYEPGTVAEIGWPMTSGRERALFDGTDWHTESGVHVRVPTDVLPLVVLDLDPTVVVEDLGARRNEARHLVDMLRESADEFFDRPAAALARKVADQIEAQTKPPRIPEPGLWGVVEADWAGNGESGIPRAEWVRVTGNRWASCISNIHAKWDELLDPTLIREGVTP